MTRIDLTSSISLIGANIIPIAGVIFLDWKVFDVMLIFWMENVVIGIINVLKMVTILVQDKVFETIFLIPFFIIHYGAFCAAQGFFIFILFEGEGLSNIELFVNHPIGAIKTVIHPGLLYSVLALFLSHFISFWVNFLGRKEYQKTSSVKLMASPYARILILHATIIFGGWAVLATGEKTPALILLVIIKIFIDLKAHQKERMKLIA